MERFPPNRQVTCPQISSLLCFECGDLFKNRKDYEQHILNHQAIAIYHRMYYEEQKECIEKRRSGGKRRSVKESKRISSGSLQTTPESIISRRHTIPPVSPDTSPTFVAKRGNLTLLQDEDVQQKQQYAFGEYESPPISPLFNSDNSVVADQGMSDAEIEQKSASSEDKSINGESFGISMCESVGNFECPMPSCWHCAQKVTEVLTHFCTQHNGVITGCHYSFYSGDLIAFEKSDRKPGTDCNSCEDFVFTSPTQYYRHLLGSHLEDILLKYHQKKACTADRAVVTLHMKDINDHYRELKVSVRIVKAED